MDLDLWLTTLGGLLGAIIGAGAALTAQHMQWRRSSVADAERERKLAIEEVLVRAQAVDMRAHDMTLLAVDVGSFKGLVARVLGTVAPVDYAAMFDKLTADANALNRAAAQVWLFGEDKTVQLSNAVVVAATEVVSAHTSARGGWLRTLIMVSIFGRFPRDEDRIATARQRLSETRRALVDPPFAYRCEKGAGDGYSVRPETPGSADERALHSTRVMLAPTRSRTRPRR